jgi:hypothetical protein
MLLAKLSSILKGSQGTLALLIAGRLIELFRPPLPEGNAVDLRIYVMGSDV